MKQKHKNQDKSLSFLVMILVLYQMCLLTSSINNNVRQPYINSSINVITNMNAIQGQTAFLQSPSHIYTISIQTLQRKKYQKEIDQSKNKSDFHRYFRQSQSCKVIDPQLQVNELIKQRISSQSNYIRNYLINQHQQQKNAQIWVLTDTYVQKYILVQFNLTLKGKVTVPEVIRRSFQYRLIKLQQNICLTDGIQIYLIGRSSVKQQQDSLNNIQISQWKKLQHDSKQQNNSKQDQQAQQVVKIIQNKNNLLILTPFNYKLFKYDAISYQLAQISIKNSKEELKKNLNSNTLFVDAIWQEDSPHQLFILTSDTGILQIKNFRGNNSQIYHHNIGQLGMLISFIKFSDVFEITFKQTQDSKVMLAQFQYLSQQLDKATGKATNNTQLLLNRFYTKVGDILDIDYVQGRLLILGDNQFFIYGPGVNRKLLIDQVTNTTDQSPYYGVCWDINNFQILKNKRNEYALTLIGIGNQHLTLYQFQRPNITIKCEFSQSTRILIKSMGTCEDSHPSLMSKGCKKTHIYEINVKLIDFQTRTAFYVTVGLLFCGCWLTLWNCLFLKCITDIKSRVRRMSKLVAQKIANKNKKYDTVVNTQTNQLNMK